MSVLRPTAIAAALLATAATASAETIVTTTTTTVTKKVERSGPASLTPQQRNMVYRSVSRERSPTQVEVVRERRPGEVVEVIRERRPAEVAVRERRPTQVEVVRERSPSEVEVIRERRPAPLEVVSPPTRVVPTAPLTTNVAIGRRVPTNVVLSDLPDNIYAQAPGLPRYRYYYVNNRLVLVDPVTSEVVDVIEE